MSYGIVKLPSHDQMTSFPEVLNITLHIHTMSMMKYDTWCASHMLKTMILLKLVSGVLMT